MTPNRLRQIIDTCLSASPCPVEVRFDEPMSAHTTFKVGGAADCWLRPVCEGEAGEGFPSFAAALIAAAGKEEVPLFFLGGGANILVADKGIRGIVLDTSGWSGEIQTESVVQVEGETQAGGRASLAERISFRSGTSLDAAAEAAASKGLGGLEFLAGMPGSIGGALVMNARAYEREIADVLVSADVLVASYQLPVASCQLPVASCQLPVASYQLLADKTQFAYKRSPFQKLRCFIVSATFALQPRNEKEIRCQMESHRQDREDKGHYRYPSAGSAFKNNREFGKPTGKIIDELGLRGLCRGGAQIAPYHGNILINTGGATAADIRGLLEETAAVVKKATGFTLEPEILFVGDWES